MMVIRTAELTKEFEGGVTAVDDLTLTVESGEVFGFLGPNGSGKSTTINLLLDLIRPTSGSAEIFGLDTRQSAKAIRQRTGILPEWYEFDAYLTGREQLQWAIRARSADDDADTLLSKVGLEAAATQVAADYSKGMKQRLALAMALVGEPDLLVLDEPSTGLDPNGIRTLREIVTDVAAAGTTVFYSSHILSEVEAVCDRVGLMNDGTLVAVDSIDGLRDGINARATLEIECASSPDGIDLSMFDAVTEYTIEDQTVTVHCAATAVKYDVITHVGEQFDVVDVVSENTTLEDVFTHYTAQERDSIAQTTTEDT